MDHGRSIDEALVRAHELYSVGRLEQSRQICELIQTEAPIRTDNLLLLGAIYYQLRKFSNAIDINRTVISLDPTLAEAHCNLGNCLKEQGDLVGAVQCYQHAVALKPRFVDGLTNLAATLMQLGRLEEAMRCYERALAVRPDHVDAMNNLGNLLKRMGRLEEASACYHRALQVRPTFAPAHSNLASMYRDMGNPEMALRHFEAAIALDPTLAEAYSNMGNVYKDLGKWDMAEQCYLHAIRLRPNFAIAHGNLGSVCVDRGEYDRAIALYRTALALDPTQPDFYDNIALAKGDLALAIEGHRQALTLQPNRPHTLNNLGNALKERGMIREALAAYEQALRLSPNFAAAHSNLANIYREQGRVQDALQHYHRALQINPNFADVYSNIGNVYKDLGQYELAIQHYQRAIELNPQFADAHSNLASTYKDMGRLSDAVHFYRIALRLKPFFPDAFCNMVHSLQMVCCWDNRDELMVQLRETIRRQLEMGQMPSVQPHHALVYPLEGDLLLALSQAYAAQVIRNALSYQHPGFVHPTTLAPDGRLRIGYVSSDYGNHPLSDLMQSVFGLHDRRRFEVFTFALSPDDGHPTYARIRRESEHFVELAGLDVQQMADRIHRAGVHILVNLNGYTKGARNEVFALQPAPVQVSYMGFPGTMGAPFIQYLITDRVTSPPSQQHLYSERLAYMPHCYFVTDYRQTSRAVLEPGRCPTRAQLGLPADRFVFYCPNQLYKIDPATFDLWCRILHRVPQSVLWLLRFPALGEPYIRQEAERRGIGPDRIVFTDQAPKQLHLLRSVAADLFLDTPVCNGHTTACDVLWAGVPLVTMPLQTMASRVAASVVTHLGCPELVVNSPAEYEELAVALATDPARYRALRHKVETLRHTCPLFDTALWVREVEAAFAHMWLQHAAGAGPATFDVQPAERERIVGRPDSALGR